jgi:hypothetical protein
MSETPVKEIQRLIVRGFGVGLGVALTTFMTVFGGSYMMNKLIYHGSIMRLMAGLLGSIPPLSLIIFVWALFKQKVPYFALFPLGAGTEPIATGEEEAGWGVQIWRWITGPILHPFHWTYDKASYVEAVSTLMAAKGEDVVPEDLYRLAQAAAAQPTAAAAMALRNQAAAAVESV